MGLVSSLSNGASNGHNGSSALQAQAPDTYSLQQDLTNIILG
jgi:hypothetical protein